jgi:hypothetical protein
VSKRFLSSTKRLRCPWAPTSPIGDQHRGLFRRGKKRPGREADYSLPYTTQLKNEWRCTYTPPYTFISCTGTTLPFTDWSCPRTRRWERLKMNAKKYEGGNKITWQSTTMFTIGYSGMIHVTSVSKFWEPQPPAAPVACPGLYVYRDCFTLWGARGGAVG